MGRYDALLASIQKNQDNLDQTEAQAPTIAPEKYSNARAAMLDEQPDLQPHKDNAMGNFDALRAALLKKQLVVPDYETAAPGAKMMDADAGFSGYGPPLPTDATDPTTVMLRRAAQNSRFAPATEQAQGAAYGDAGTRAKIMSGETAPQTVRNVEDDVSHKFAVEKALGADQPEMPEAPMQQPAQLADDGESKFSALATLLGRGKRKQ